MTHATMTAMVVYLASIVVFLASTTLAIWRLRSGSMRTIIPALLLVAGSYVLMVTSRSMTEATATVAVLTIDVALLAVGVSATLRLLGGWEQPTDEGFGFGDGDGDDGAGGPAPGGSGRRARFSAWDAFDEARRHWEHDARRRERQERMLEREPEQPLDQ